ncbi:MAG: hypothetical protein OEU26_10920 [Candidatus Tectomicrobia bacterium]|nr:hypothetical protein [Candidatus Tectomicrobia bacterium]
MLGTPGINPEGFFFEVCNGKHPEWAVVRGNPFSNPYTKEQLTEQLDIIEQKNPAAKSLPWVRREYFGEWITDDRRRVISLSPSINYLYDWKPQPGDQFIIGVDWGDRYAAFVVGVYNRTAYPYLVFLEANALHGMLIDDHVKFIRSLMSAYPGAIIVADPGGVSRTIVREIRETYQLPVINAQKSDRKANVEMLNNDVSLGKIKIFNRDNPARPEDSALAKQWNQLVWVEDRAKGTRVESAPRDVHDAALYARRYAHTYLYKEPQRGPEPGTPEWYAEEARQIRDKKERSIRRKHRKY